MPIFVQLPLAIAGLIAAYFVSRDTLRFTLFQTAIALVMLVLFCIAMIYGPRIWRALNAVLRQKDKQ